MIVLLNTGGIDFFTDSRFWETLRSERLRTLYGNYEVDLDCLTMINKD